MEVDVKNRDGVIVLKPRGRLVGSASNALKQAIEIQLKDVTESPNFLFDFADCLRIDSANVGVIVGLHVSITQRGGVIGVTNLSNSLKSYFVMAKLVTTFKHFNSESEGVVNLRAIGE
ncbi:STAS domain-containing protein [Candidatus Poribacteria bacterium]|nr:STAS domain-containing protein [Candidatus Poribacteria bacterium]